MKQAKFLQSPKLFFCAGLLSAAVMGCGKEEIKVYTAPKDTATPLSFAAAEPVAPPDRAADPMSVPPAKAPITWKTPANWKELAPTQMRVGNFSIAEGDQKAEMAILPFPGSVGGELENVNRWRGEIGLGPVEAGGFTADTVKVGSETAKFYDLPGPKFSTLAVWMEKEGMNWFFKMRGDKDLVAKNKPVLVDFLKTIQFTAPATQSTTPATANPAPTASAPVADYSKVDPASKFQYPSHWKEGPQKSMVVKNWDVTGEGDQSANIAISSFPGEVGGVVQNVNRWRGQLNLERMSEQEIRDVITVMETTDGHSQALYVDFTGKDRSGTATRMISAIVPHGSDTWFYKIMGDPGLIEREKAAFLKLVQTANYH